MKHSSIHDQPVASSAGADTLVEDLAVEEIVAEETVLEDVVVKGRSEQPVAPYRRRKLSTAGKVRRGSKTRFRALDKRSGPKKTIRTKKRDKADTGRYGISSGRFGGTGEALAPELLKASLPWQRRRQLKFPTHRATTAHSCTLFPWGVHGSLGNRGPYLGQDVLAGGGAFHFDLFETYEAMSSGAGSVTNTNMVILGQPGVGKSALVKTLLYRTAALYGADRFFAIMDVKSEYTELAELLGLPVIKLRPGGKTRVNPLHIRSEVPSEERTRRRNDMLMAMLGAVVERRLSPIEEVALWTAIESLDSPEGIQPTMSDLVGLFVKPSDAMVSATRTPVAVLSQEIQSLTFALEKLVNRSLGGMFDGQSTVEIDPYGRGVVIDISSVQNDTEALPVVMVAATAWLQDLLVTPTGVKKLQVLDESWRMVQFEATARYLQSSWKLGRTYGVGNIAILHKAADLGAQTDDGSAASKIASGLIADTAIRVSYSMTQQDLLEDADLLGLSARERATIVDLERGCSLWKIGNHVALLDHVVPEDGIEAALCNTDQAFEASPGETT